MLITGRITSYNVCYTKLLRPVLPPEPETRPIVKPGQKTETITDETAPEVNTDQSFSYAENQVDGAVVGIVAATDDVVVTGFQFSDTGTNTSLDGYFTIAANGQVSLTAAGIAAGVAQNDFETA